MNKHDGVSSAIDNEDPLFGTILAGPQSDGKVLVDLSWGGYGLLEMQGVEHVAGLSGFESADDFYRWVQAASGSVLSDWYGVELRLHESWYPPPFDEEGNFCYATWGDSQPTNALASHARDLFCLRHVAWTARALNRRAFNCARTRSYCEAAYIKEYPGEVPSPTIMAGVLGQGLLLTGIRPGEQRHSVLEWPTPDMHSALDMAAQLRASGVQAIRLLEEGIGVQLDHFSSDQLERLLQVDRYYGGDIMLSDALQRAGLFRR